jgi:hypothetical protein
MAEPAEDALNAELQHALEAVQFAGVALLHDGELRGVDSPLYLGANRTYLRTVSPAPAS